MNADGIKEIANMQVKIDSYRFFVGNLLLKLSLPDKDVACISTGDAELEALWKAVDDLQKKVKDYERKTSIADRE